MLQGSKFLPWLYQQQLHGISPGLTRIEFLLEALGHPEKKKPVFHIAGTNGKGSVAAFSASLLKAAGVRVGLYTSPHLLNFRERIQIDNTMISLEDLDQGLAKIKEIIEHWSSSPTFFEITTALAFHYFAQSSCDVIVLETGMGGRLDATNVATEKIATAITAIGLDHQEYLGSTLRLIAQEKAGIMRPEVPLLVLPQERAVMDVLEETSHRLQVPLRIIEQPLLEKTPLGLAGSYQRWNGALALQLIEESPWKLTPDQQARGLENVSWPGRFQRFSFFGSDDHEIVLDGAHNPQAVSELVVTWKEIFFHRKCLLIFGALTDKKWELMLSMLDSIASEIYLVPVASTRTLPPSTMKSFLPRAHLFSSLREAFDEQKSSQRKKNKKNLILREASPAPILVTGSLFLVAEALSLIKGEDYSPFLQ